jgi:hypothetical protein
VTETDKLWSRGRRDRHAELYDAEYARQLERMARIRDEVSAGLPGRSAWIPEETVPVGSEEPPPRDRRPPSRWDVAPGDLQPAPPPDPGPSRRFRPRTRDDVAAAPVEDEARAADASRPRWGARGGAPERADAQHGVPGAAEPARRPATGADAPPRPGRRPVAVAAAAVCVALACVVVVALLADRGSSAPALTVFTVPAQPTGLAAAGGAVWVAGPGAGEVWVLDARSGRPAGPPLTPGGTPAKLALDARFAWIADTSRGAVVRMPRQGRGSPKTFRAGADVADVAIADGAVWTASSADGTVRVLGPHGRTLQAGRRPIALAAAGRRVVVLDAAGFLVRYDARTQRRQGRPLEIGGAPVDVALTGGTAWVADAESGFVRAIDVDAGSGGPPIDACRGPAAIAADARGVYVICRDRTLVDLSPTGTVRRRTRLAHIPTALALDPRHVWIAAGSNEVIRVDR